VTETDGYRIDLAACEFDAARFEELVARARGVAATDPAGAAELLGEAEGLWRGEAFGELADLFGVAQGGPLGILIAAAHPSRTSALVLWASYARLLEDNDYPWGRNESSYRVLMRTLESTWGSGGYLDHLAPSVVEDPAFGRWWAVVLAIGPGRWATS
jgi:pimeloyl-ACP methyl ester carboxylesterase